jgi:hypothetical protein
MQEEREKRMMFLVPGVALYAVVGLAVVCALCRAAALADAEDVQMTQHALEHSAVTELEPEAVLHA